MRCVLPIYVLSQKQKKKTKNEYELNAKRHNVKAAHDQSTHETEETRQKK